MKKKKSGNLKRLKRQETLSEVLFILPQYALYLGLVIVPFFIALPIVFTDRLDFLDKSVNFIGFNNFVSIFKMPIKADFYSAYGKTALFTLLNYFMSIFFGLSLALFMYEYSFKFKQPFFVTIFLPFMVSGMGIGMLLTMLFSRDTGSYNILLLRLGLIQKPLDIKTSYLSAILPVFTSWRTAGFNMAIFLSGLLSIPQDTIDAAKVDGVNYGEKLIYIYLPQIVSSITIVTIFSMLNSFGIFDEPVGLGALQGNPNARFLAIYIYQLGFLSGHHKLSTLAMGITVSMVVYLPLLLIAVLLNRLQKRLQYQ